MFHVPEESPHHPMVFYKRLLQFHPDLEANEPSVAFLMRDYQEIFGGKQVLGTCSMPRVNGRQSKLFDWMLEQTVGYVPDFLFTFETEWWNEADDRLKTILMDHEMCHARQAIDKDGCPRANRMTGDPVYCIVEHDVTEFNAIVARYGAWSPDIKSFIESVNTDPVPHIWGTGGPPGRVFP